MKKRILMMAAMLFLAAVPLTAQIVGVAAQEKRSGGGIFMQTGNPVEQKTIGEASLECTYEFHYVTDTIMREEKSIRSDIMILQTGNGISKFYSYFSFRSDSLIRQAFSPEEVFGNKEKYRGGASWVLYRNYPDGKWTFMDRIETDWFLYEEEPPAMEWEIGDETREIEGYVCQKAECDFRGRHWTVWFSPEVPVSEGPWKLGGLPGLIMQAYDRDEEYTFTLTGLRQVDARPVILDERQFFNTNRENYLKTLRKTTEDPFGWLGRDNMKFVVRRSDGTVATPEDLAPKEMKYDFLETDYR